MIRSLLWPLWMLIFVGVVAQAQEYTLSGYVKDEATGEDLIGATVTLADQPGKGAVTNLYGFYSFTLPKGEYKIIFNYVGYQAQTQSVVLDKDIRLNVELSSDVNVLQEVEVSAKAADENVQTTQMSAVDLQIEEVKAIPALMGEVDILKTIQLLPGVQSAGEGNTGLYVRGGGPDQNLVLLDEAIVYNPGHLFGFFSVFNADAIRNTTLIKGGMPAQYGGRLSSVVDVSMKEGNNKDFTARGGVGLISSRLTLEGPLVKDKSSFMLSGRRTYVDVLLQPFIQNTDLAGNAYYFYDLNAKLNYRFSDKDRLYVSGYFGRDVFSFTSSSGDFGVDIPWGNTTLTTRWNHLFSDKLFMNASLIYNNYDFSTEVNQFDFDFRFYSEIEDINAKLDFDYFLSNSLKFKFGLDYFYHTLTPITASLDNPSDSLNLDADRVGAKYAHEGAAYVSLEADLSQRLRITAGLRASGFQQIGPYRYFEENTRGDIIDTIDYTSGEAVETYGGWEPRLSMRYLLDENTSIKGAFTINRQYLHLVSNSNSTLPTDVWVPSSKLVEPQIAYQYSLGLFKNFKDNTYETSVEFYYKDLQNQIEFEDGYIPGLNQETERSFVFGRGYSYGMELFLKKRTGKLNGWIGYTLSWTNRVFPDINNGEPFPARFDRRHDLSVVGIYELNDRWTFSTTFVYGTGNAFTLPESWYFIEGNLLANYGTRNSYRLQPYHRLDLSATLKGKETKKFASDWVFSIYNVYSRLNPFFIFFETEGSANTQDLALTAKQVSLFPIIPTVTWNFTIK
mgnify:CR=1 FL=1